MLDPSNYSEWVRLNRACELTGLSVNALREYIKKGHLHESIHWVKRQGRLWINLEAFNQWVKTGT
jgi:predicted site-specific integrase-resolvase